MTQPWRRVLFWAFPWLKSAKASRGYHDRLYGAWGQICDSIAARRPYAADDPSFLASIGTQRDLKTGEPTCRPDACMHACMQPEVCPHSCPGDPFCSFPPANHRQLGSSADHHCTAGPRAGELWSREKLMAHAAGVVVAGMDTTAHAVAWGL